MYGNMEYGLGAFYSNTPSTAPAKVIQLFANLGNPEEQESVQFAAYSLVGEQLMAFRSSGTRMIALYDVEEGLRQRLQISGSTPMQIVASRICEVPASIGCVFHPPDRPRKVKPFWRIRGKMPIGKHLMRQVLLPF